MLILKRNETEVGVIYDDESLKPSILPWDWYYQDDTNGLRFSIETVGAWKDAGNAKALMTNIQISKEDDSAYLQRKSEARSAAIDSKMSYLETLFVQD